MSEILKACGRCGARYDLAYWDKLPVEGAITTADGSIYEMRRCPCGKLLALPILPDKEPAPCTFECFPPLFSLRSPWVAEPWTA